MPDEKLTKADLADQIEAIRKAHRLERTEDLRRINDLENAVVELSEYNRRLGFHLKRYVLKTDLPGDGPAVYQKIDEGIELMTPDLYWSPDKT